MESYLKKLTIVSLGPGDPELLTLKAYKTLQNSDAVCIPTKAKDSFEKSRAYEIVTAAFIGTPLTQPLIPVYSPMKLKEEDWQEQIRILTDTLEKHECVAYVTLGDAGVYSTAYYLLERLKVSHPDIYETCEIIPGITSFSLASAKSRTPLCLGEETLTIRPFKPKQELQSTTVYMRGERGMPTADLPLQGNTVFFERLEMEDEVISETIPDTINQYMSLLIDFAKR